MHWLATGILLIGALIAAGHSDPVSAERYITIENADGSIDVRRVEEAPSPQAELETVPRPAPASSADSSVDASAETSAGSALDKAPAEGRPGSPSEFEPDSSFVDAEALEKQGFSRDQQDKFYTYIDETGLLRSRPIDPRALQESNPDALLGTGRQVVTEEQWLYPPEAPGPADPEAVRLLGLADKVSDREIDRIAAQCCQSLLSRMRDLEYPVDEFSESSGIALNLDRDEADFGFGTGRSLFRVVDLAELDVAQRLRMRTYLSAKVAGKPALMYPAVLTLDGDWTPVRLLNNIVYAYGPESWFSHAYLEGFFDVDPSRERYLVVFSRQSDRSRKSVVYPDKGRPQVMAHARYGTIELSPVGAPPG